MAKIKRSISDGVGVSGGGSAGSSSPGISTKKIHGGGGGGGVAPVLETAKQQPQIEQPSNSKAAYAERLRKNQEQYRQQQEAQAQRASEAKAKRELAQSTTGKYEKGGEVLQETRGEYETLKFLKAQQPGSAIVQTESGEYVLIRASGKNYTNIQTLEQFNEKLATEGKGQFFPTEQKNKAGGIDYTVKIFDTSGVREPEPSEIGGASSEPIAKPPNTISTKYAIEVGSGKGTAQFITSDKQFKITLEDSLGGKKQGYQKTRLLSAREISEGMTAGKIPLGFIGKKGADIKGYERTAYDLQNFGEEQLPITYTDKKGKELFTITGQSKGSKFEYFLPTKQEEQIQISSGQKIEANKIFPFPLEAPRKGTSDIELAKQTAVNIGIDIVGAGMVGGVPQYTKPVKEQLAKSRKETQVDLLFQSDRWKEIQPMSKEFLIPASVYAASLLVGGPKTIPFRIERTTIPTVVREGIPILGKPEGSETIFTGLKVGYGKYSKYVAGKTSEGKIIIDKPSPRSLALEKLTPPSSRGGFPLSEETSGLLTSKPYLTELIRQGKLTEEEATYIIDIKRGLEITERTPDIVLRTDIGNTPVSSLRQGKETKRTFELLAAKQKAKELPGAKGSLIQQYYTREQELRRSRDIDLQLQGSKQEQRGKATISSFETELQKVAEPGRTFEADTKSLTLKVKEGVREEKVMELLTKESAGKQYPSTDPSKVFGMKVPFKEVKPADIKTLTYRFQGLRKGSSSTELTAEGVRPAKGREKDIFDLYGYFMTKSEQISGKKGEELKSIAINIKRFAEKKGLWATEGRESTVFELPSKVPISKYGYIALKVSRPLIAQPITPSITSVYPTTKEKNSGYYDAIKLPSKSIYSSVYQSKAKIYPTSRPTSRPTSIPTSRPTSFPTSRPTSRPISQSPPYSPPPPPIIIPPIEPPPKIKIPFIRSRKEKRAKEEAIDAKEWRGNVPEFSLPGVYRKFDIVYGEKAIAKQRRNERTNFAPIRRTKKRKDLLGFPKGKRNYNIF